MCSAMTPGPTPKDWTPGERFLEELHALFLARRESARRPAVKAMETFYGTFSKLRPWWELVRDYVEIHESTIPTESI